MICDICRIGNLENFEEASVAQKMSWASRRQTTRVEDEAYCLMGLLGVNMPTIYGEGRKAFYRLQLEVMKISDDEVSFSSRFMTSIVIGLKSSLDVALNP